MSYLRPHYYHINKIIFGYGYGDRDRGYYYRDGRYESLTNDESYYLSGNRLLKALKAGELLGESITELCISFFESRGWLRYRAQ
ncbi:hypothetical protein RclHR1_17610005 [Rhizophagus clarus]|uniref:Uncharacterized protein n=1 Tax=Rhizophagus clarus TaxID=94130 RepID=A0A2Z6RD94_9GLOM|nr:hypothetical protein RclHR1_17610005 [Rhizophagus clarus]GET03521.1 hypothetical protein RCL_e5285_RclHR1_17610005 [Rhizophagus clarus]